MYKTCEKNNKKDTWIIKENTHEGIVSKELYEKVQEIKKNKHKDKGITYEYLLKDLLYCGHCKKKYQYKLYKSADRKRYLYESSSFKCSTVYKRPDQCKNRTTINEKHLNEIVIVEVKKKIQLIEVNKETNKIVNYYKSKSEDNLKLEQCKNEIDRLERKKGILYKKKCDNFITAQEFKTDYERIKKEIHNYKIIVSELEEKNRGKINNERIKEIIDDFKNGREFTNEILKEIINKIEVYEDLKVIITFNF